MSLSGKLWPTHPHPLPNELLSSWLVRLAHANGLKVQTFCQLVFGREWQVWVRDVDRFAPEWLIKAMCMHTGTPEKIAWRSTLAEYEGWLYPHRNVAGTLRWITPLHIHNRKREGYGLAFCPACLAEDEEPYFRLSWRVAFYTFCPYHDILMYDHCPNCSAPVVFQRTELGKYEVEEFEPLCVCHRCSFDLRNAPQKPVVPYNNDAFSWYRRAHISANWNRPKRKPNMEHLYVLHQLCKILVSLRQPMKLQRYVEERITAPPCIIPPGKFAFEARPIQDRHHIIQLASWLIRRPEQRIRTAWEHGAVKYNELLRDFSEAPEWFSLLMLDLNRRTK